jgi:hypothetical protein
VQATVAVTADQLLRDALLVGRGAAAACRPRRARRRRRIRHWHHAAAIGVRRSRPAAGVRRAGKLSSLAPPTEVIEMHLVIALLVFLLFCLQILVAVLIYSGAKH